MISHLHVEHVIRWFNSGGILSFLNQLAFLPEMFMCLSNKNVYWYTWNCMVANHLTQLYIITFLKFIMTNVYIHTGIWPSVLQLSHSMSVHGLGVIFPRQSAFKMWPPSTVSWQWWVSSPGSCYSHSPELHSTTRVSHLPLLRWDAANLHLKAVMAALSVHVYRVPDKKSECTAKLNN